MAINAYYNTKRVRAEVSAGGHRKYVGGLWDEIGRLQLDFLLARGLTPSMRLLDVGCGCLRGGVHFVDHLQPGRYYGMDLSQELLDAGYDVELVAAGLQDRVPREHLICDGEFRFDRFGERFDMAIAQSVFTHLPLNHIRLCLARLAPVMEVGATLYATIFARTDWMSPWEHTTVNVTTRFERDPYHYRYEDIEYCASDLPWEMERIGEWGHPRDQVMVALTRTAS